MLFLFWYQYKFSMDEAESYKVNAAQWNKQLLIATQGSDFKDALTKGLVDYFKSDSIFIQVEDIQVLEVIDPEKYDALVIIHTWENWKPPVVVESFIERTKMYSSKIVVLTTSGEGSYKMDDVDAITGESILADTEIQVYKIIDRLGPLLQKD